MNLLVKINALFLIAMSLFCCVEFIEYPLENKHVDLLVPSDGHVSTDTPVNFWRSTHQDARYYRLQSVRSTFEPTYIRYKDPYQGPSRPFGSRPTEFRNYNTTLPTPTECELTFLTQRTSFDELKTTRKEQSPAKQQKQ